jgi:hypothetical protein
MSKLFKYNSKLVGVTFEGRQAVISTLTGKEQLRVRREADNEYDPNAVAVDVLKGEEWLPIGYIAKDKNLEIAKSMDADIPVEIVLSTITGGDGKSFGVNIELQYKEAPAAKTAPVKTEAKKAVKPTKEQMQQVLAYLTQVVDASGKKTVEPATYNSVLLGKNIEVQEVNGHKRLEGFLSGSKFPEQFYQEFDSKSILEAIQKKHGLTDAEIKQISEMWDVNSLASTNFGNSIHYAMENYDRNYELGDRTKSVKEFKTKPPEIGANKALSRNPVLKKIVESFHELFGGDYIRFNEEFVWDREFKLCGSIDRIKVVDLKKRIIRIQDFKTDADIHEKKYQLSTSPFKEAMGNELLDYHWLQLSFYAFILNRAGWKVEGLDVYWMNGEKLVSGENPWEEFSHDVIDISEVILGVE